MNKVVLNIPKIVELPILCRFVDKRIFKDSTKIKLDNTYKRIIIQKKQYSQNNKKSKRLNHQQPLE